MGSTAVVRSEENVKTISVEQMTGIIQCFLSLLACILAWIIPEKIKWEQKYNSLCDVYRSMEYGAAIQAIVDFFVFDCSKDVSKIHSEYRKRFLHDFYPNLEVDPQEASLEDCRKVYIDSLNKDMTDNSKILHYQRRLLVQFFYEIDLCANSIFIGKRRIGKDYTSKEADILKILFNIDEAVKDDPVLMKDISSFESIPSPEHVKGINKGISRLYFLLKKSKREMEV